MLLPRNYPITLRLTLYFSIAMGLVLYSVSGLLYSTMRSQLTQKDEDELRSTLHFQQEIATTISERQGSKDLWQQELFESVARQERLSLRIISADGKVWAQSQNMRVPRKDFPAPSKAFNYTSWRYRNHDIREKYLIASTSFTLKDNHQWLVQAALNVSQNNQIIEDYWGRMQGAVALAIVLFAAIGYWLARRGLSPLRTMSHEIAHIHAEDLHTRLSSQAWPSELNTLSTSFDGMMMRLEASFTRLNRFSSDIAHELRGPINNLVSAASVTQSKARSPQEYNETLAAIVEEGEHLSRMISSMLFLARADNSREPLHLEQLNSVTEFTRLVNFYDVLAEEKQIILNSEGDVTFFADPIHLQRALSNLLSNALRHTAVGGCITLSAIQKDNEVLLSVKDNGEGISNEHLPHIFDRFYRGDDARSKAENTGLGLSLVKTIAEMHGGKIIVTSEESKGSCFTLVLPQNTLR
ncbi:two-component system, OmpR family, heavy metal sensor histidine kinase CusS [Izhakiella capsodis]|uniref:Sensor protein n=1 Tax=Izhakiella capsodis TaxID=1367852 RepID=A0A1I4WSD6_9GAMM|nr:heavy metal sensor histidine kinase [Izhakiella capsodis]SFN16741.1 two-component system, OmpR family, heavy metal sensor histidine kinase CusS [Izhakiella capsodis]